MARKMKTYNLSLTIEVNISDKDVVANLVKREIERALGSDHTNQFWVSRPEIKESK